MNQFLLAFTGIPASGKTSLARQIVDMAEADPPVVVVDTDLWRDQRYYEEFKPENEKRVRRRALDKTKLFLTRGWCVIHDDTNYYESMRHQLYDISKRIGCAFAVVHVATPLDVALSWNRNRQRPIPEDVVRSIAERLDPPGLKYSWDKALVTINLAAVQLTDAAESVLKALESVTHTPESKIPVSHKGDPYDTVTRQVVRAFLEEYSGYVGDTEVSRIRREVMHAAKEVHLSPEETRRLLWDKLSKLTILSSKR